MSVYWVSLWLQIYTDPEMWGCAPPPASHELQKHGNDFFLKTRSFSDSAFSIVISRTFMRRNEVIGLFPDRCMPTDSRRVSELETGEQRYVLRDSNPLGAIPSQKGDGRGSEGEWRYLDETHISSSQHAGEKKGMREGEG